MARVSDALTREETVKLAELLTYLPYGVALEMLALARGEHPDLWLDGKPLPWPPSEDEPEPWTPIGLSL
jgi:hypothetical protein